MYDTAFLPYKVKFLKAHSPAKMKGTLEIGK
jgi:hypothetical protein